MPSVCIYKTRQPAHGNWIVITFDSMKFIISANNKKKQWENMKNESIKRRKIDMEENRTLTPWSVT